MEGSKNLFCSSTFLRAREWISSKFTDNLGSRPQKVSPALTYTVPTEPAKERNKERKKERKKERERERKKERKKERKREACRHSVIRRRKLEETHRNDGRYKSGRNWLWPVPMHCCSTHAKRRIQPIEIRQ
jgi:hypothetical protein